MARKRRASPVVAFRSVAQAALCAVGLLGGLAAGGLVIYVTGLWSRLDGVLSMPFQTLTINDLIMVSAPFAVIFGCSWLGAWVGLRLAAKI